MDNNQIILDKLLALTEHVVKLKIENERLKTELKHEKEINAFLNEHRGVSL